MSEEINLAELPIYRNSISNPEVLETYTKLYKDFFQNETHRQPIQMTMKYAPTTTAGYTGGTVTLFVDLSRCEPEVATKFQSRCDFFRFFMDGYERSEQKHKEEAETKERRKRIKKEAKLQKQK